MQQKEIYFVDKKLITSFQQNKMMASTLRESKRLDSHDKKINQSQRFQSGKEYVFMARKEIQNRPLMPQEEKETLQSRPRATRIQSTQEMINKQLVSRRNRHLDKVDCYKRDLELAALEEKKVYDDIQKFVYKYFVENDQQVQKYFHNLTDENLLKREEDILQEIVDQVENNKRQRQDSIQGFDKKLNDQKNNYHKKVTEIITNLDIDLNSISYLLKPEISQMINQYLQEFNESLVIIEQRNSSFLKDVDQKQSSSFENFEDFKINSQKQWRLVKHNQQVELFLETVQTKEYTFPQQRLELYKELKEVHYNVYKNRLQLKSQLQNLNISKLSQLLLEKFNQDCQKLNEFSSKQYDAYSHKLINSIDKGKKNAENLYENFCNKIHHYNAEQDQPLDELLQNLYYPYIQQIIENDKKVFNYLEDTDFQTCEVLSNIAGFYSEIAKKMDTFKKNQQEFLFKYKIKQAKIADQNDEDNEILSDELNVSKQQIREAMHHLNLDVTLQNCFNKLDQIESIHQENINLTKLNPGLIKELVKENVCQFVETFKLVAHDQKQTLLSKYQAENDEKIKLIMEQEEQEKEKLLQEQAQNPKKGAKAPPKKDPKKAQLEYDNRIKELRSQFPLQVIKEFEINGILWIELETLETVVQGLLNVEGFKEISVPIYENQELLTDKTTFEKEVIYENIEKFRQKIFDQIESIQEEMIEQQKIEDDEFIQLSLIDLDEKLKLHYPKKGQVEVEIYQKRSAQITEHKDKYERHSKQIFEKNQYLSQQYNFIIEECMKQARNYVLNQKQIEKNLPKQNQLSKLQGQLNQSKESQFVFQEKYQELLNQLEDLSFNLPQNLIKSNEQFLKQIQETKYYFQEEIQWYETMLNEISEQIKEQQQTKMDRFKILESFLKDSNLSAIEQVETQYKVSQEELAQKDGTGKLYGRPRRLAQEKIRFEMTKCEQSQEHIQNLINKIKESTDCTEIRDLLIQYRNCVNRYQYHLEALKPSANQMIRLSRDENAIGVLISKEQENNDNLISEQELEKMGSISFQSDKNKRFSQLIQDIETQVILECQKIYTAQCPKWLNGADKLPDWIRPYLQQIKYNMKIFREQSCRELCISLQKLAPEINQKIFFSLQQKFDIKIKEQLQIIQTDFDQYNQQDSELKKKHNTYLRPNLSNPACKEEYDNLCQQENLRQKNYEQRLAKFKKEYLDIEYDISNKFFVSSFNFFEFLIVFYDNLVIFEDFQNLPGDEQTIKKNQNLQTLLKLKQSGNQIDYDSERSITKQWPTILMNTFQVDSRLFQFVKAEPVQDVAQSKGKPAPKKEEIIQNETKQLQSYKTFTQKTAYQNFIQKFNEFKKRFDQSIEFQSKIQEEFSTNEKKFQYQWGKNCKSLFN